jgi:hypothetical protein
MNPPRMEGLFDPDDWIGWWSELHPSDLFHGHLGRFAIACLRDPALVGAPAVDTILFSEGSEGFEVEIRYLVEDFRDRGRVFHVLSIRSEGDPVPPVVN